MLARIRFLVFFSNVSLFGEEIIYKRTTHLPSKEKKLNFALLPQNHVPRHKQHVLRVFTQPWSLPARLNDSF